MVKNKEECVTGGRVRTGVKTFGDGGGVDVVASTETAGDEVVQRAHGHSASACRAVHLQRLQAT